MSDELAGQGDLAYWVYRGGQINRGGGEFYGDDGHGIETALYHAGLSSAQMAAQPDQVSLAFGPLRELAAPIPSVSAVIDLLQAELRKKAESQPKVAADFIRIIATFLPGGVKVCKKTLDALPPDTPSLTLMRETLNQLPE